MNAPRAIRTLRRVTLALAAVGLVYLWVRFDTITIEGGRSPIHRYGTGDRLIVDLHARDLEVGNAIIARDPEGGLHLALVARISQEGAVWLSVDHPEAVSSEQLGWFSADDVLGRVVLALPW